MNLCNCTMHNFCVLFSSLSRVQQQLSIVYFVPLQIIDPGYSCLQFIILLVWKKKYFKTNIFLKIRKKIFSIFFQPITPPVTSECPEKNVSPIGPARGKRPARTISRPSHLGILVLWKTMPGRVKQVPQDSTE